MAPVWHHDEWRFQKTNSCGLLARQAEEIRSRDQFYVRFLFRKLQWETRGEEVIKKLSGIWRPFFFIGVLHFPRCATIFRGDIVLRFLSVSHLSFGSSLFLHRRFSFFLSLSLYYSALSSLLRLSVGCLSIERIRLLWILKLHICFSSERSLFNENTSTRATSSSWKREREREREVCQWWKTSSAIASDRKGTQCGEV